MTERPHANSSPLAVAASVLGPEVLRDKLCGVLLGAALGDALGLPGEGMSAPAIARRFGRLDRFRLFGSVGFVSDDTEQAALVAQSLARQPLTPRQCADDFRHSLVGWFLRLPWGVGLATVRACFRSILGSRPSGVRSAGNGAAMRAGILGAFFHDRPEIRVVFGRELAEVTHTDERAVAGALFVAELSAALCGAESVGEAFVVAAHTVREPGLVQALARVASLAEEGASITDAAKELGVTGYVLHTVPFAAFCLLRHGGEPLETLVMASSAGGDTDSIGAILGGWLGAWHGEQGLPANLIDAIHDGPFGPTHLRRLGRYLATTRNGDAGRIPGYFPPAALARNLALYPVILAHGVRRLLP